MKNESKSSDLSSGFRPSPHPKCRLICGKCDHTTGIGPQVCGTSETCQLGSHNRDRDLDGLVVRADGMHEHGLPRGFAQESQRLIAYAQPA